MNGAMIQGKRCLVLDAKMRRTFFGTLEADIELLPAHW